MNLLAITGKKQSGKDEVIRILRNHIGGARPIIRLAFADPLKLEVASALHIKISDIEDNKVLFRPLLQWWGTDWRRRNKDDYWIEKWLYAIKQTSNELKEKNPLIICPDVRFINEANTIKYVGGKLWKVIRYSGDGNPLVMDESDVTRAHISETELDLIAASTIINNTTMKAFESEVIMAYESWMKKLSK